ncbi:hypothetical protein J4E82_006928 [Alternaria postmessia]|uniref:uncharacterized protein n=1 Tax=Alternaria postmessia TaxID=1187938 RepID=UPI002225ACF8|nr:uncharacterized protein J4E82_006928 [Alternaria postmessia]KAI5374358.1 hypothetical protein J4E82_006928 [Alternaria postmessia]
MSLSGNNAPTDTQTRLAHALGFTKYPKDTTAVPYLNYILKRHTGTESKEAYIELFVKIIEHFQSAAPANGTATDATVQSLVNELTQAGFGTFFAGTAAGDVRRKEIAEDTVMLMLGTWATMYSSFQHKRQRRKVVAAYRMFADQTGAHTTTPYDNSLSGLIAGSGLLPGGQWDQRVDLEGDAASKLISLLLSTSKNPNQTSSPEVSTATPGQALPSGTLR